MRKLSRGRARSIALSKVMRGIDNFISDEKNRAFVKELDRTEIEKCKAKIRALWNSRKHSREQIRILVDWIRIYENKPSKGIYFGGVFGIQRRAERRRSAQAGRGVSRGASSAISKKELEQ